MSFGRRKQSTYHSKQQMRQISYNHQQHPLHARRRDPLSFNSWLMHLSAALAAAHMRIYTSHHQDSTRHHMAADPLSVLPAAQVRRTLQCLSVPWHCLRNSLHCLS